ncbi:hypothetical protein ANO11243_062270 [Dothideomycetidae sp. 11243]|nr:hypothetical protein ANO11243_062270 [fungal sp. No.11243]
MKSASSFLLLASVVAAALPPGLQTFYDQAKTGTCAGADTLGSGFKDTDDGPDAQDWVYCQQGVEQKAIFIKGNGQLANMDIDCDGDQKGNGPGTACASSSDTQSETAFKDTVSQYGIRDLDANIHPYVVFGNQGSKAGYKNFDPQAHGVRPLSVMAVVCNNKVVYGIWGDTNGDDGPPLVGEAALSVGLACFGPGSVNGNSAHDTKDVLYIAFTGQDAVPGKSADWKAGSYDEFEASIKTLGDKLVADIFGGGASTNDPPTDPNAPPTTLKTVPAPAPTTGSGTCAWKGHCEGAACKSENDCSGSLVCSGGKCAPESSG